MTGLEIDSRTLALLDSDTDGHVRPPEIIAAVRWLRDVVKDGVCALGAEPINLLLRPETQYVPAPHQRLDHMQQQHVEGLPVRMTP